MSDIDIIKNWKRELVEEFLFFEINFELLFMRDEVILKLVEFIGIFYYDDDILRIMSLIN